MRRHLRWCVGCCVRLLDQLQYSLLSLVGLLQGCHASGLQDVVLRHVGHGLADVGILNAIGCALQVRDFRAHVAAGRREPVDSRATGTVISAVVFALWVGVAIGGAIASWLLDLYGYSSTAALQSARALDGIRLTASVWSGAAFLAAAVCLLFYRIDKKLNLEISNELAERRKGFGSAS